MKQKREYWCAASRGREQNGKWVQQLEILGKDYTNSITTVQKDNYIIEIKRVIKIKGDL